MYKKQLMFFSAIAMLFSAFFFGCDKESNIGIGLVPDNEKINTSLVDTFPIIAHTYKVDGILSSHSLVAAFDGYNTLTDSAGISKFVFGNYFDPVFGKTTASFVTEMIRGLKPEFGPDAIADSLVLQLYFDRYDSTAVVFGSTDAVNEINVSQINTPLSPEAYYRSNDSTGLLPVPITTEYFSLAEFMPKAKVDSVLSIKLDKALGQRLIDDAAIWAEDKFTNYFNGLLISPSPTATEGAISIINLTSSNTKVVLYYKNDAEDDSLVYNFNIDATCARYNLFNHDYTSGNLVADLDNPESKEEDVVYVQGAAGLRTKIQIPTLGQLRETGIWGVNKAELIIPVEDVNTTYPTPLSLQLRPLDSDGNLGILDEFIGENLQGVTAVDGIFTFDITYWAQQVIRKNDPIENHGFMLIVSNENTNPSGVVLGSPKNNSNKMKLLLTRTKLGE